MTTTNMFLNFGGKWDSLPFIKALHGDSNSVGTAIFFLFETHGFLTRGTY